MSRVSKREDVFYTMFREFGASIDEAGDIFLEIVQGYPDTADRIGEIKAIETVCDSHVNKIMTELYGSFITPFDREDITELVHGMDGVIDALEGCAARFDLFHVEKMLPEAVELARLIEQATTDLHEALDHFKDFKKDRTVIERTISVSHIEDDGDMAYRQGLARMYEAKVDPLDALKWTGLLEKMEDALDGCSDVAATMQAVIIKNA